MEDRIIIKAHELFMRYGIRSISMDEIAAQLGVSKKTIYNTYADKDALVEAAVDIEIRNNETECIKHSEECENAIHEIFLAMDMVHEMMKSMNPAILYDLRKYHPTAFKKFTDHKNKFFFELIKDNLARGIKEELYRPEINIEIMSKFRIGSMFLVFDPEIFPYNKTNITDVLWEITENFLYGLSTSKGVKNILKYKQQRIKNK